MKLRNAAVQGGKVVAVDYLDDQAPKPVRADGATWIDCREWVVVGCQHNGNAFLLPDGSRPQKDHIQACDEQADHNELVERLLELPEVLKNVRAGTGTNAERIARIEKVLAPVARGLIRLYRS